MVRSEEWSEERINSLLESLEPKFQELRARLQDVVARPVGGDILNTAAGRLPAALHLNPSVWGNINAEERKERIKWSYTFITVLLEQIYRTDTAIHDHLLSVLPPQYLALAKTISVNKKPSNRSVLLKYFQLVSDSHGVLLHKSKNLDRVETEINAKRLEKKQGLSLKSLQFSSWEGLVQEVTPLIPKNGKGNPSYHLFANTDSVSLVDFGPPNLCLLKATAWLLANFLNSPQKNVVPHLQKYFPLYCFGVSTFAEFVQVVNPKLASRQRQLVLKGHPGSPILEMVVLEKADTVQITVVDTEEKVKEALIVLKLQSMLAVDVEGSFELTERDVWMVQIGLPSVPHAFLFDFLCFDNKKICEAVQSLMENESIVKVFHDARGDVKILHETLGIRVKNIKDTQVLHGIARKFQSIHDPSVQPTNRVGLNTLLQEAQLPVNPLKKEMRKIFEDPAVMLATWTKRPMIDEVKRYAAYDVLYLCPLVEMLEKQINKASVNMATKLCNQHASLDEEAQESAEQYLSFSQEFQAHHTEQPVQEPLPPLPAFMANNESLNDEDLELLLLQLPNAFAEFVRNVIQEVNLPLLEIKLDAGRPPILLFAGEPERVYEDYKPLPIIPIVKGFAAFCGIAESDYPSLFTSDNRMGLASTLHRISCLKSRHGEIIGLTLRIGRHVPSVVGLVLDLVQRVAFEQRNLLLLGAPGKGKTTLLRSVIQALNLYFQRRVIVVDTSNEIAGDGVVPHPSIGYARRMHVPDRARQHSVLIRSLILC